MPLRHGGRIKSRIPFFGAETIMQKQMLVLALAATVLAACGKKEEAPAPGAAVPAEDKVVNVYNWPDYIAEDLVPNFEKASGLRVNYSTFENNEGLQANWREYCKGTVTEDEAMSNFYKYINEKYPTIVTP